MVLDSAQCVCLRVEVVRALVAGVALVASMQASVATDFLAQLGGDSLSSEQAGPSGLLSHFTLCGLVWERCGPCPVCLALSVRATQAGRLAP